MLQQAMNFMELEESVKCHQTFSFQVGSVLQCDWQLKNSPQNAVTLMKPVE